MSHCKNSVSFSSPFLRFPFCPSAHPGSESQVQVAQDIAAGRLNFDNVGSQIAHEHCAERASNHAAEIEHTHPRERSTHTHTLLILASLTPRRVWSKKKVSKAISKDQGNLFIHRLG
jgi:hypothetical protein